MVGSKLTDLIKEEIKNYLGIPYARNVWRDNVLKQEAVFGGKGTWQEIHYATLCAADKENLKLENLSTEEITKLQKRHRIGIDCSGLTYHLLNKLDQLKGGSGILFKVTGIEKNTGIYGVRSVSAAEQAHSHNSVLIKNYEEIECGDLIRHNNGTHILFIVEKRDSKIIYVHSSKHTLTSGVHYGEINLINPDKSLNYQEWSDTTKNGISYQNLFDPENYDGIYRLKSWKN